MSVCRDDSSDSSSDFVFSTIVESKPLDSVTFRLALKKARAKHGLF